MGTHTGFARTSYVQLANIELPARGNQQNADEFMDRYNNQRTHQGKRCRGKTPMATFMEGKTAYSEKNLNERFVM